MYITFSDDTGKSFDVPVHGVGGVVRFAIGQPGLRSSVWRVWAGRKSSDVYIAAREAAGVQKFSLHESGRWRYAYTSEAVGEQIPEDVDRAIDKWDRRDFDEAGRLPAVAIEARAKDLCVVPNDGAPSTVRWIAPESEDSYTSIRISIIKPDTGFRFPIGGALIDGIRLVNDWFVLIVAATETGHGEKWVELEEIRDRVVAANPMVREVEAPRLVIFGNHDETGIRMVYDMTVPAAENLAGDGGSTANG